VSFNASPDYRPDSFDAFCAEHLRSHDFDRELSSMAERDGQPIGFLLARHWRERGVGFVDLLGVHPDHRTRGLGATLLQASSPRFAASGLREAQLGVASDNPNALRLYERVGMGQRFRYDTYRRPAVRPGGHT
jgi:mycothiol synthase